MTGHFRRFPLALAATTVVAVAACSPAASQGHGTAPTASSSTGPSSTAPSSTASASAESSMSAAAAPPQADSTTTLVVPAGEGGGALSTPHRLTVPSGWTARVWARVPDARMEAWTPEEDLLVSVPDNGGIMELRPDAASTATVTSLLSGLTYPQGMAFARLNGQWVLYVAESDQIDRYPWGAHGISGARTVIAKNLPDLDS